MMLGPKTVGAVHGHSADQPSGLQRWHHVEMTSRVPMMEKCVCLVHQISTCNTVPAALQQMFLLVDISALLPP